MNSKELFALALRIIGVLTLMYIARAFIRYPSPSLAMLVIQLACAAIAVCLVRGAPPLVKFAYPEPAPKTPEKLET